ERAVVILRHAIAGRWQQRIQDALLRRILGPVPYFPHGFLADHLDGDVHEIPDDAVDLAANVADLGELGCLDLDERRAREPREPTRNLGLADAGRADHQDVLRRDLAAQWLVHLHAAPAVPQRDGDRS